MKVLLVNTNRMKPRIAPIGLDYLADSLQGAGHEVRLLDLCFAEKVADSVAESFRDFTPSLIGVTIRNTDDCYFSGQAFFLAEIREIIASIRKLSDAPVVLGGAGYSVAPRAALEFCQADFGIAGEGELALLELIKALEARTDLACVPNLVFRDGGSLRENSARFLDLSQLPPRHRRLADNARYFREGGQAGFESKRGCAMPCIYCADPVCKGRTVRLLPPEAVVTELANLHAQGIDYFHTCDCEFNLPREHAVAVCKAMIASGLGERIRWYAYCAPTPFDDEMALLFKGAGCAGIDFGADSGCDEILAKLGRHFTSADLVETAAVCHRHQIPFMYDLLLGGPGETKETLRRTIELMRRAEADCVGLSLGMRIYPGTRMAEEVVQQGDLARNPNLYGAKENNPDFLRPVFYIASEFGDGLTAQVRKLVGGDRRFFLPEEATENSNYNYNENIALVQAIAQGARGAYWDILRRQCRGN